MAGTILTRGDMAVLRPLWGKGADLRLWAENGLVCWESSKRSGEFGSMTWQEAAYRVLALSDMVAKSVEGGYASERQQIQRFISEMERVIRKAKDQGGPDDLVAAAEEQRRRKPKQFIMPKIVDLELAM